jgi:hypothetical protein
MKRRGVERAPIWLSWAAPTHWWLTAVVAGVAVGAALFAIGAPSWVTPLSASIAAVLADVYWRQTRLPSQDAPLSLTAQLFYDWRSR